MSACQFGQLRGGMSWGAVGVPNFVRHSQGRKEGRGFSGWSVSALKIDVVCFFFQ